MDRTNYKLLLSLFVALVPSSWAIGTEIAEANGQVQELHTKNSLVPRHLQFGDKRFPDKLTLTRVTGKRELVRELDDVKDALNELVPKIDFDINCVVLARWKGSNSDTVTVARKDGGAEFSLNRGPKRDLRARCILFLLDKEITVHVSK